MTKPFLIGAVLIGLSALVSTAASASTTVAFSQKAAATQYVEITAIKATFNEQEQLTTYSVDLIFPYVLHMPKDFTTKVTWSLKPPGADPGCDLFYGFGYSATWQHGDKDGCNHKIYGGAGHPGTVRIEVTDNYGGRCVASYYGTISGTGDAANCGGTPPHISTAGNIKLAKESWDAVSDMLDAGAASEAAIGAGALVTGIGAPVTVLTGASAALLKVGALLAKAKAKDPPDPNFAQIAKPQAPPSLHIAAGNGIPDAVASAFNLLAQNEAQTVGLTNALLTSVNRAQGAARAGNAAAKRSQNAAAAQYAQEAASLDDARPGLRAALSREVKLARLQATLTPARFRSVQQAVARSGLPKAMVASLRAAGVAPDVVAQIARAIAAAKPPRTTLSFPNALASSDLDAADARDAGLLRAFAKLLTG